MAARAGAPAGDVGKRTVFSGPLVERLHARFCKFQVQAKRIQDRVEETQMPVDSGLAEDVLQHYSCGVAETLRAVRDDLRRGKWDIDSAVRAEHDALCVCLAVWELAHELAISSAPSAARLLHWYNRHYLEEEIAEWWQAASRAAEIKDPLSPDSPLWEPLVRLALADCHTEVLAVLKRVGDFTRNSQVARVCEFLRKSRPLLQMEQAHTSLVDFHRDVAHVQSMARRMLAETPADHPTRQLLEIYAGCDQGSFEANEDVGARYGRTWIEDVAYAHAWIFPEMRKTELGDLLRAVAQRRTTESIDDLDRVFFAVLALDIPALLKLLEAAPDRFPSLFVAHLADALYFAGRLPLVVEAPSGEKLVPPRDWHLMAYAKEIGLGSRGRARLALDYLRSGGSEEVRKDLKAAAEKYCETANTDAEMDEAMALLVDLGLAPDLGPRQCRLRASHLRDAGDLAGCLRWACQAEHYSACARGYHVSEMLDSIADSKPELDALLSVLTSEGLDEPLARYPPESLVNIVSSHGLSAELVPSGRLYFIVQYARCRALKLAGRPSEEWAPCLVGLLTTGSAGPASLVRSVVQDDLLPVLSEDTPALSTEDALQLMRYVQGLQSDPFRRVQLTVPPECLHQAMGLCLSRAVLRKPVSEGGLACAATLPMWTGLAPMAGLLA